jgi:hypothetical protein
MTEARLALSSNVRVNPPVPTAAQDKEEAKKAFFPSSLDFSVPTSAAQAALGISPSLAESPVGVVDKALNIINDPGASGLLETGFSYTGNLPSWGLVSQSFNWVEYTRGKSLWQMRNTHLSMALVRGATEDDKSMRGAVGLSVPLFDASDWRVPIGAQQQRTKSKWDQIIGKKVPTLVDVRVNSYAAFVPEERQEVRAPLQMLSDIRDRLEKEGLHDVASTYALASESLTRIIEQLDKVTDEDSFANFKNSYGLFMSAWEDGDLGDSLTIPQIERLYTDFSKEWDAKFWNAPKANVSAALTWFSPDEQYSNLKQDGSAIWTSYANAIGSEGQYALFGRYYNGSRKWNDTAMNYDRATGYQLGLKILMAGSPDGGFFAEYLYDRSDRNSAGWKDERTIQIGFERKMSDGLWLQISLGSLDDGSSTDRSLFGLSFNYNIGHDRMIKPDRAS